MSEFKVGEVAIYAPVMKPLSEAYPGQSDSLAGKECEILSDLLMIRGIMVHRVRFDNGDQGWIDPPSLRKKRPPEQPADDQEFINWCNTLGRDTEEIVRRIHPSAEEINRKAYMPLWFTDTTGDANG